MNIVFLGYPGSGKGTQAKFISEKLNMVHFSPSDIFWDEINKKTPLGMEVHDYLSQGRLVPDWLVLRMLKDRLTDEKRGILFDGFPRTQEQAEALDSWLNSRSSALNIVIYFSLAEAAAAKRLEGRVTCLSCGRTYPAPQAGAPASVCAGCGGTLKRREDDSEATIKKRMMSYRDQTEQLLYYYRSNGVLREVKADQPQQAVTSQIALALKSVV